MRLLLSILWRLYPHTDMTDMAAILRQHACTIKYRFPLLVTQNSELPKNTR